MAVGLVADKICQRPRRLHLGGLDMRKLDPFVIGYYANAARGIRTALVVASWAMRNAEK